MLGICIIISKPDAKVPKRFIISMIRTKKEKQQTILKLDVRSILYRHKSFGPFGMSQNQFFMNEKFSCNLQKSETSRFELRLSSFGYLFNAQVMSFILKRQRVESFVYVYTSIQYIHQAKYINRKNLP